MSSFGADDPELARQVLDAHGAHGAALAAEATPAKRTHLIVGFLVAVLVFLAGVVAHATEHLFMYGWNVL